MANSDSERKAEQPETKENRLRQEINQVSKEIADYEKAIEDGEALFKGLNAPFTRWSKELPDHYQQIMYTQRKLGIAQQKLTALILELLTRSSDQLDSDVRQLGELSNQLDSDTKKIAKSSRRLEVLTYLLIFIALITFAEAVVRNPPSLYFISLEGVIALIMLILGIKSRIFTRKESPVD